MRIIFNTFSQCGTGKAHNEDAVFASMARSIYRSHTFSRWRQDYVALCANACKVSRRAGGADDFSVIVLSLQ